MNFELTLPDGSLILKQAVSKLLKVNEKTAEYGVVLTEQQATALLKTRETSLQNSGRIEFGGGAVEEILLAFCDSPYISPRNYEETLHDLIELFYDFKSDTWDKVTDRELIGFMKSAFNGSCKGSLELLSGRELPRLSRHIHSGKSFYSFRQKGEGSDGTD